MSTLNIPSYSSLLTRDRQIKSIQELYENVSKIDPEIEQLETAVGTIEEVIPSDASEDNQLADKEWVTEFHNQEKSAEAATGTTLIAALGTLYRFDQEVNTLTITLPAMESTEIADGFMVTFLTGATPAVTITSADSKTIRYYAGYSIEPYTRYELNFMYNGSFWVVAYGTVV